MCSKILLIQHGLILQMILHLILNSLIVFLALALFVELILYTLRVKNLRICYLCRSLPILKIPFDLLIFLFYGDSLFINLNPLSCEIYVQELIASFFPAYMPQATTEHLIIPQYIASQISSLWLLALTIVVVLGATAGIIRKLFQFFHSRSYLKHVLQSSSPCSRRILNIPLQNTLQQLHAIVLISPDVEIPFAANSRYILFPQKLLNKLTQNEFEAVISHEIEHLRWRDPFLKLLCALICTICWWIPTNWWLKRFIADQEQASDAGVHLYGIDRCALASAVTKTLRNASNIPFDTTAICLFDSSQSTHLKRIERILNASGIASGNQYVPSCILGLAICLVAFVSLWMC